MSADFNAIITSMDRQDTEDGPLADRTVAVKDNISTAGVRTTCGSRMLEEYVPPFDATVVERLIGAGAHLTGKANLDEFGMGSTTETSAYGPTKNPRDPDRVPGGSSGGSAAAVASGEADLALGTDTGGSVRNPAAFCGVVGLKPSYGLVSRYGLIAYANSLEQVGPIARTVTDAALLLDVIAGPDDRDPTCESVERNSSYTAAADKSIEGMQIGIPTTMVEEADQAVADVFWDAIDTLEARGAHTEELRLSSLEHAVAAYYVLATSEASSNLARFDGVRYGHQADASGNWNEVFGRTRREGFGEEVIRRILLGTFALSAGYQEQYYQQAHAARAWIREEFEAAFDTVDVIASPTMPTTPWALGDALEDPLQVYISDANTVPANLAGLPGISVPAGTAEGLPVGMQFLGPRFGDGTVIQAGAGLERARS